MDARRQGNAGAIAEEQFSRGIYLIKSSCGKLIVRFVMCRLGAQPSRTGVTSRFQLEAASILAQVDTYFTIIDAVINGET